MTEFRKKLIEVVLPLVEISEAAASEKDIHTGKPANLHPWWSRKPLPAARAVILASLLDDPVSPDGTPDKRRRKELLDLVGRIALWDGVSDPQLEEELIKAIESGSAPTRPLLVDPFCGGGSIPLEGLRLGLDVEAGDLNPVAAAITRAMVVSIPKAAGKGPFHPLKSDRLVPSGTLTGLAEDVRLYGQDILKAVEKKIGKLFPPVDLPDELGGGKTDVIAWVWCRTVQCPNPGCQKTAPLVNKFWLSTHKSNEAWARPTASKKSKSVIFTVESGGGSEPPPGTVNKSGARCFHCGSPIPFEHIREQGQQGRLSTQLMSMVVSCAGRRVYLPPTESHEATAISAKPSNPPETLLPDKALGFRVQNYGITRHSDMFMNRQLVALEAFSSEVAGIRKKLLSDTGGDAEYANAAQTLLAFSVDRLAQTNNTLVRWLVRKSGTSKGTPAFDRPIVPMTWEFSEGNVLGDSVGSWKKAVANPISALKSLPPDRGRKAVVLQLGAQNSEKTAGCVLVSTDPPYYDNIGYSHLSDFFYIWMRRALRDVYPDLFRTMLVPKEDELTAEPKKGKHDGGFMHRMKEVLEVLRQRMDGQFPMTLYYAFKEAERSSSKGGKKATGWEALLEALVSAGFQITGSWPIHTEQRARLRALGSNALASSIVLVCRKKDPRAESITLGDFQRILKAEMPLALQAFQDVNIAPVDLAQACIGPGMSIFSRHARVLEHDGTNLSVRAALKLINEVVDEIRGEEEADFDRESRFAITWFASYCFEKGAFGEAETLAKARNVAVSGVEHAGVLKSAAGKVRLLKREEMPEDWDPLTDKTLTVWECTQHLIKRMDQSGEQAAAELLAKMGPRGEQARILAYRLYTICDRKKWADEARAYNGLVIAWPELERLAAGGKTTAPGAQGGLFEEA